MIAFDVVELRPQVRRLLESRAEGAFRKVAVRRLTLIPSRLVDQGGGHGSETSGIEVLPDSTAQALGHEQIALSVDATESAPVYGCCHLAGIGTQQVAELEQHVGHAIEDLRYRTGAGADLAAELIRLLLQLPPALRPTGV